MASPIIAVCMANFLRNMPYQCDWSHRSYSKYEGKKHQAEMWKYGEHHPVKFLTPTLLTTITPYAQGSSHYDSTRLDEANDYLALMQRKHFGTGRVGWNSNQQILLPVRPHQYSAACLTCSFAYDGKRAVELANEHRCEQPSHFVYTLNRAPGGRGRKVETGERQQMLIKFISNQEILEDRRGVYPRYASANPVFQDAENRRRVKIKDARARYRNNPEYYVFNDAYYRPSVEACLEEYHKHEIDEEDSYQTGDPES